MIRSTPSVTKAFKNIGGTIVFVRYCVINAVENYVYIAYDEVNTAWKVGHIYPSLETRYVVTA